MFILLGTVFVASLLGSLHCVGMCGPFALLASANAENKRPVYLPTLAYSLGRLFTYAIVGAIFGTLGMALNKGTEFAQWQQTATYAAGALMVIVGLISVARQYGMKIRLPKVFQPVQRVLQHLFGKTKNMSPIYRALTIGGLSTLMPCGWLYTFAIAAAGTGSPVWGATLMMVFWLGTLPIMTALVLGVSQVGKHEFGRKLQTKIPMIMACLVVAVGVFTIGFRAPVVIGAEVNVVAGTDAVADQIKAVDQSELPCCQEK